jgi:hypothetical protein
MLCFGLGLAGHSRDRVTHRVSMKHARQYTKGYAQGSDFSIDRCASYKLDGDVRHGTRFYLGSTAVRRNTYILRLVCIAVYDEMCFERVSCPPYIV